MEPKEGNKKLWLSIVRWSARIMTVLIVGFFGFYFIADILNGPTSSEHPLVARDYIILSLIILFNIGLLTGLWREGLGGLISFVFMSTLIILHQIEGITPIIFYATLLPSILYLLSWYFHRRLSQK